MKKGIYAILTVLTAAVMVLAGCDTASNPSTSQGTPTYRISISPVAIAFTAETGYTTAPAAQTVTVTNSGNAATGELTITLGANADKFTLSKTSISDIKKDGTATFTIAPIKELGAGTYKSTVTVSGKNEITATLDVTFSVGSGATLTYGVSVLPTSLTFEASVGYTQPAAKSVTVSNSEDNEETGPLTVALTGTHKDNFTLSATSISNIKAGESFDVSVVPKAGLGAGSYTATVTVSNDNIPVTAANSFSVTFTVKGYGITLKTPSNTSSITFTPVPEGYAEQPTAKEITIENPSANAATGALTVALEGTNKDNFTLSRTSITNIAPGAAETFDVKPNLGLATGDYTATITVKGDNITTNNSVPVEFKVNPANSYGIIFDPVEYDFADATVGDAPEVVEITVINEGNVATGPLTVTLDNTDSFTVLPASIPDIAVGGSEKISVTPKPDLIAGYYTATITVSGDDISDSTVSVSLIVKKPVPEVGDFVITGLGPFTYDGSERAVVITPTSGKSDGVIIRKYNSATAAPVNAGTYEVTFDVEETVDWAEAIGLVAGQMVINRKAISDSTITVDPITPRLYSGSPHTPEVIVKDGSSTLALTTDYTVAYSNNTAVGTNATVTITGVNNYSGSRTETFEIIAAGSGATLTYYWVDAHGSLIDGDISVVAGTRVVFTKSASASGYTASQWSVDGVKVAENEDSYEFSSLNKGPHNVTLVVLKGGNAYSTTFVITVN